MHHPRNGGGGGGGGGGVVVEVVAAVVAAVPGCRRRRRRCLRRRFLSFPLPLRAAELMVRDGQTGQELTVEGVAKLAEGHLRGEDDGHHGATSTCGTPGACNT